MIIMNKCQWFVLSIGLIIFGSYMLTMSMTIICIGLRDEFLTTCYIREYAYAIPGLISIALGFLFNICGWLEKDK